MAEDNANANKGDGAKNSSTDSKPSWQALGYATVDEFTDKALEWKKLSEDNADRVSELEQVRDKQSVDFRRQSTEVGDLKKQVDTLHEDKRNADVQGLKKTDTETGTSKTDVKVQTPDEILADLDEARTKTLDEFLDKPENIELKKKVLTGGIAAMAEFAQSYEQTVPLDMSKPIFQGLNQRQASSSDHKQSIIGMVQEAFRNMDKEQKKQIPAGEQGQMTISEDEKQSQNAVIGGVSADYYRKDKES